MAEQNEPYLEDASTRRGKETRAWARLRTHQRFFVQGRAAEKAGAVSKCTAASVDPWLSNEDCRTQAENSPRLVERGSLETPLPEMIAIERRVSAQLYGVQQCHSRTE